MLDIMMPHGQTKSNIQTGKDIPLYANYTALNGHLEDGYSSSPDTHHYIDSYPATQYSGARNGANYHTVAHSQHAWVSRGSQGSPSSTDSGGGATMRDHDFHSYDRPTTGSARSSPVVYSSFNGAGSKHPEPLQPRSSQSTPQRTPSRPQRTPSRPQRTPSRNNQQQYVGYASPVINGKKLYGTPPANGVMPLKPDTRHELLMQSLSISRQSPTQMRPLTQSPTQMRPLTQSFDPAALHNILPNRSISSPLTVAVGGVSTPPTRVSLPKSPHVYHATPVQLGRSEDYSRSRQHVRPGYHRSRSESQDGHRDYVTLTENGLDFQQSRHMSIAVPNPMSNAYALHSEIPPVNPNYGVPTNIYISEARKVIGLVSKTQPALQGQFVSEHDVRASFPQTTPTHAPSLGSSYPFSNMSKPVLAMEDPGDNNSVGSSVETPLSLNTSDSSDVGSNTKKKGILRPLQTIREKLKMSKNSDKPMRRLTRSNSTPDVLDDMSKTDIEDYADDDYGFLSSRYQYRSFRQKARSTYKDSYSDDQLLSSSVMQKTPGPATESKEQSPGVKLLSKKWRKSKAAQVKQAPSQWKPVGSCCWCLIGQEDVAVELKSRLLLNLAEVEHHTLQKIALTKLQTMGLGCPVSIPKHSGNIKRSKSTRFTLKKKSSSTNILADKDSSSPQLVFGIPLAKVISNDLELKSQPSPDVKDSTSPAAKEASISSGISSDVDSLNTSTNLVDAASQDSQEKLSPHVPQIPHILTTCCRYLTNYGLDTEGIFRKGSSKKRVSELKQAFNAGAQLDLGDERSVHDVACLLKEWLRELPDPLLTKELFVPFTATRKVSNEHQRLTALQLLLCLLPVPHRDTLYELMSFLHLVSQHSESTRHPHTNQVLQGNRMDSRNLTTVIGPNLLHRANNSNPLKMDQPEKMDDPNQVIGVVGELLDHYQYLFEVPAELQDEVFRTLAETDPQALDGVLHILKLRPNSSNNAGPGSSSLQGGQANISTSSRLVSPKPRMRTPRSYPVNTQHRFSVPSPTPSTEPPASPYFSGRKLIPAPELHVTPGSPQVSHRQISRLRRPETPDNPELLSVPIKSRTLAGASVDSAVGRPTHELVVSSNSSLSSGYHGSGNLSRSRTASPAPDQFQRTSSLQRPLSGFPINSQSKDSKVFMPKPSQASVKLPPWQKQRWDHWELETKERSQQSNEQETLV